MRLLARTRSCSTASIASAPARRHPSTSRVLAGSSANSADRGRRFMRPVATANAQSEPQFAALVEELTADPGRCGQLTDLLREDHPIYRQHGAATIVRMRGWVLLALARAGVSDAALIFVLEELDTGIDAYLVAAAARALRSYQNPGENLAPFVMRALTNIRYRDEPVCFEHYGEYAVASTGTSPVRELLATLTWLGP